MSLLELNTCLNYTCDGDEQPLPCIVGNASATDPRGYQQYHGDGTLCRDDTLD